MSREDCVLRFRTSGPNYRTKQMASGDARDLSVTSQQIGTQSLKELSQIFTEELFILGIWECS